MHSASVSHVRMSLPLCCVLLASLSLLSALWAVRPWQAASGRTGRRRRTLIHHRELHLVCSHSDARVVITVSCLLARSRGGGRRRWRESCRPLTGRQYRPKRARKRQRKRTGKGRATKTKADTNSGHTCARWGDASAKGPALKLKLKATKKPEGSCSGTFAAGWSLVLIQRLELAVGV